MFLPNWVGDVVMATPALRALRGQFAGARITYIGRKNSLDVLAGCEWADATLAERSQKPALVGFGKTALDIRAGKFDLAVLLPNSFRAAALARLGGGVPRVVGYDRDGRGWMLSEKLAPPRGPDGKLLPVSAIEYYNAIAVRLGAPDPGWRMELPVLEQDQREADAILRDAGVPPACGEGILPSCVADILSASSQFSSSSAEQQKKDAGGTPATRGPLVMLNPGASFGPSKLWPAGRYAELADALIEKFGAGIIINAAPSERDIAAAVAGAMKHRPLLNLGERANSLGLVKGLLRRCRLLITNDTGARHLAAALGAGVVTIFGSTDPARTVLNYARERIVRADVPCSPCQQKTCPNPSGATFHQCMTAVTPEKVLEAAEELLTTAPPAEGRP